MRFISILLSFIYYLLAAVGLPYGETDRIFTPRLSFEVQTKTDVFCPPDEVWVNGAEYPTLICLSHNGEKNGTLLASFEVFDKGQTKFRIVKSEDKGSTWSEIAVVTETLNPALMAAWEPCLFELPAPMGRFGEGTVILGGISLDDGCQSKTQLSLWASENGGVTWQEIGAVDEAGGTGDGIWEPWFVFENGVLYCFYSDDSDPVHSQTIVYKSTADLVTWGEKVPVVTHRNPEDRPGMPVVTKMGNGQYYLTYELLANGENRPCRYKISDSLANWNPTEEGTEILTPAGRELHTSPVCLWIPRGGKNGTLLVNAQYENKGQNEWFVSFDCGKTYSLMASPFRYRNAQGFGYSPAMVYDENENEIYCMNSVDFKGDLSKIQFVRLGINE